MPFTKGHEYLINFARGYCGKLTVMVCSRSFEQIPGDLRFRWIHESFPDVIVKHIVDDTLPQDPSECDDPAVFRDIWVAEALKAADGMQIDYFFASEDYGGWMAAGIGAKFVPVDPERLAFPVSGTEVRNAELYGRWDMLPAVVRADYVRKVVVFGPESTGKTTIARHLAACLGTVCVPEYGRIYVDAFGGDGLAMADFENIRMGHEASVRAMLADSGPVLIEDTDPLMTAVWCSILTGSKWFGFGNPIKVADFYLLCDVDLPWVDDGTRYFESQEKRKEFFDLCVEYLEAYGARYSVVRGSGGARLSNALSLVRGSGLSLGEAFGPRPLDG